MGGSDFPRDIYLHSLVGDNPPPETDIGGGRRTKVIGPEMAGLL